MEVAWLNAKHQVLYTITMCSVAQCCYSTPSNLKFKSNSRVCNGGLELFFRCLLLKINHIIFSSEAMCAVHRIIEKGKIAIIMRNKILRLNKFFSGIYGWLVMIFLSVKYFYLKIMSKSGGNKLNTSVYSMKKWRNGMCLLLTKIEEFLKDSWVNFKSENCLLMN